MKRLALRLLGLAYELLKRTPLIHVSLAKRFYYRVYAWSRPRQLTEISVQGNLLWIDPQDQGVASFLLTRGCYEPFEASLVQRLLQPGDCFLDIGANFGYYTVIAAQAVGAAGRVFAFEPDPHNFELLQRNVTVNNFDDRVTAIRCAIGAESGSCQLFLSKENLGDHRIVAAGDEPRTAIDVPLQTLDDAVDLSVPVDLIKMDIQGAELLALAGMRRLLNSHENIVVFTEFWPEGIRRSGHEPEEFVRFIGEQRFAAYVIDEPRERLCSVGPAELERLGNATQQCNLLLVRGARCRQISELQ